MGFVARRYDRIEIVGPCLPSYGIKLSITVDCCRSEELHIHDGSQIASG